MIPGYECEVLADSLNTTMPHRVTTVRLRYPMCIHHKVIAHREFSVTTPLAECCPLSINTCEEDAYMPIYWGACQDHYADMRIDAWQKACKSAFAAARELSSNSGVHMNDLVRRVLAPYMWVDATITFNDVRHFYEYWGNETDLPIDEAPFEKGPQPYEMQIVASMIRNAVLKSQPKRLREGQWHLPMVPGIHSHLPDPLKANMSAMAAALGHSDLLIENVRPFVQMLIDNGQFGYFEHACTPSSHPQEWANIKGWMQFRRTLPKENIR